MFPAPEVWAQGMVKRHGPKDAARIAQVEARPVYGVVGHEVVNPNINYFTNAHKWIVKRYPVSEEKCKD